MVRAMFAKKVSNIVCANGGSDIKFISLKILQDLLEKGAQVHVTKFEKSKHFGLAAQNNGVLPCFREHVRVHDGVNTADFQETER